MSFFEVTYDLIQKFEIHIKEIVAAVLAKRETRLYQKYLINDSKKYKYISQKGIKERNLCK